MKMKQNETQYTVSWMVQFGYWMIEATQCCPSRQAKWYQNNIIVTYISHSCKQTVLHEDHRLS